MHSKTSIGNKHFSHAKYRKLSLIAWNSSMNVNAIAVSALQLSISIHIFKERASDTENTFAFINCVIFPISLFIVRRHWLNHIFAFARFQFLHYSSLFVLAQQSEKDEKFNLHKTRFEINVEDDWMPHC